MFLFSMLTSFFALIKTFLSSLLTTISHATLPKLFNYDYNNFAFDYALPFDVNANLGLEANNGIYVRSSRNSNFIGGIEGLGTKGRIDVH